MIFQPMGPAWSSSPGTSYNRDPESQLFLDRRRAVRIDLNGNLLECSAYRGAGDAGENVGSD